MTHPELLAAVYSQDMQLLGSWNDRVESNENIGAFVFLPECYRAAEHFDQIHYEFLPLPKIQAYLEAGGRTDEGLMNLLVDFGFGEEFRVMIVEYDGTANRQAIHIHRIAKAKSLTPDICYFSSTHSTVQSPVDSSGH